MTGVSFKPWVSSSPSTFITALTGKQEREEALGQGRTVFFTEIIDSNALDICQQVERTDGAQIQPLGVSLIGRDLTIVLRVFAPQVGRRQQHGTGCPAQTSLSQVPWVTASTLPQELAKVGRKKARRKEGALETLRGPR